MRILFFSSVFPRSYAATRGTYSLHLCEALANNHQVRVVSPVSWLDWLKHRRSPKLEKPTQLDPQYPIYGHVPRLLWHTHATSMRVWVSAKMRRAIASFRPDCMFSYWTYPDGAVAQQFGAEYGIPVVNMVGGSDVMLLPRAGTRRETTGKVLKSAAAVVTVGEELRSKVIELGVPGERVFVVPRGLDLDAFTPDGRDESRRRLGIAGENVLLFVGNLVSVKGLDVLLAACSLLRDRSIRFQLYVVGQGALKESLQRDIEAKRLSAFVRLVGPKRNAELPDWYRSADLTVLPSRSEGVPNVLRESLACGTPFVATDVGGIREVAEPGMSRLVPAEDSAALATAMEDMLAAKIRCSAPRGQLTWQQSADALAAVLEGATHSCIAACEATTA